MSTPAELLRAWLQARLAPDAFAWLEQCRTAVSGGAPERQFFMNVSATSRHTGTAPLDLTDAERAQAEAARPGWRPGAWTCDQAGRTLLVLSLPGAPVATLDRLFECADLGELIALYQALPVLPEPKAHVARCAEGVRTNMTDVFRAVAHSNPYPKEHLPEAAWNQMVLKSLFIGVELAPIDGLDERANVALMRMLCDYAHERWAAGRDVSPELWRCVGPFADDAAKKDLERVLATGNEDEKAAARRALENAR
ncbi:MAG: EboA domain-containing protein [Planctomycetota bacterium]|jgi:hypothetical protein